MHSGKFAPRENNPLYMQYVGINCNPRQGDTIIINWLITIISCSLVASLIHPCTGKSCDISQSAYNFKTAAVCLIHYIISCSYHNYAYS